MPELLGGGVVKLVFVWVNIIVGAARVVLFLATIRGMGVAIVVLPPVCSLSRSRSTAWVPISWTTIGGLVRAADDGFDSCDATAGGFGGRSGIVCTSCSPEPPVLQKKIKISKIGVAYFIHVCLLKGHSNEILDPHFFP